MKGYGKQHTHIYDHEQEDTAIEYEDRERSRSKTANLAVYELQSTECSQNISNYQADNVLL